jgi:hypothetical protein
MMRSSTMRSLVEFSSKVNGHFNSYMNYTLPKQERLTSMIKCKLGANLRLKVEDALYQKSAYYY